MQFNKKKTPSRKTLKNWRYLELISSGMNKIPLLKLEMCDKLKAHERSSQKSWLPKSRRSNCYNFTEWAMNMEAYRSWVDPSYVH